MSPRVPTPPIVQLADELDAAAVVLASSRAVAVLCHENPDADTLGGALALADALGAEAREVEVLCGTAWPSTLAFLPNLDRVRTEPSIDPDVVVLVDCATPARVGPDLAAWVAGAGADHVIVIDHHRTNSGYGTLNCLDQRAAASSEIVARLIDALGVTPSADAAVLLLAGILHDTDLLRAPDTSPDTIRRVADLVELGASVGAVSHELFGRRPAAALRLWGQVARDLEIADNGRIAVGVVRQDMLDDLGAAMLDAEDLPDLLAGIDGIDVALLLREVDGGTRVSIRTAGVPDAAEIASHFGGGGHDRAAGCTLPMPVDAARSRLLADLQEPGGSPADPIAPTGEINA